LPRVTAYARSALFERSNMERILIIGCGGAGKSTLARQLGEKTGIPVVHLDKLFWKPGWVESTKEEIDRKILEETKKPAWIIDGNYNRTLDLRLQRCDTVIYLDFSTAACLLGVVKRVLTTYGTVRPDMGDGCPERFDWEFLRWVANYNRDKRKKNYGRINAAKHAKVIILKNRREVTRFLESL